MVTSERICAVSVLPVTRGGVADLVTIAVFKPLLIAGTLAPVVVLQKFHSAWHPF